VSAFVAHLWSERLVHRLCWTLVHSLWQGGAAVLLLAALLQGMRRSGGAARHAAACVGLALFGLCPLVTFYVLKNSGPPVIATEWQPATQLPETMIAPLKSVAMQPEVLAHPVSAASTKVSRSLHWSWEKWVVVTWLMGVCLLIMKHTAGWLVLQRLRTRGLFALESDWQSMVERLGTLMKLPRSAVVCWSSRVCVPIAFGWWRPMILLPLGLASGLSPAQIEMILAHEMAHLCRRDYLVNLVQSVVEMMLFYHPATWWMARQIRKEREHACDDLAVRAVKDSGAYARALVALAEFQMEGVPALALAAGKSQHGLYARVERLLRPRPQITTPRALPGLAAVLALILAASLPSGKQQVHAQAAKPDADKEIVRGTLFDRNGIALAITDKPDRQIVFDLDALVKAWAAEHGEILPTYQRHYLEKGDDPSKGQYHEMPMPDAVKMFEDVVLPKLGEHHLAESFDAKLFRERGRWQSKGDGRWRPNVPGTLVVYRRFMSEEDWKRAEAIKAQIPGMQPRVLHFRHYPYGALAAHLLGYVKEENLVEMLLNEKVGVAGAELTWERNLAPKVVNGRRVQSGDDVYLTLDARHQMIAEQTLRAAGVGRGAAVLMQVDSGDVLAMASVPSFAPTDFVPSITREKFESYAKDETNPLLNRTIAPYCPGSAFLPVPCLAAVMNGKGDPTYECAGSLQIGSKNMRCWVQTLQPAGHGKQNMAQALEASCNVYFYHLGMDTGIDAMESTARMLGLGVKTGCGLPQEDAGLIPGREWYEKREHGKWSHAMSANTAIGQGYVLTTPLQMAGVLSTVANGGTAWRPRLVERIVSKTEGRTDVAPRVRTADLREHGLTADGVKQIQSGLHEAVWGEHGASKRAASDTITIAGRTGTSQVWRSDGNKENQSWFVCYAPADHPRWALAVLVLGGKTGSGVAAPIARHILEQVAAVESGTLKVELKPLAPAKGHFDPIEKVEFPGE